VKVDEIETALWNAIPFESNNPGISN